MQFDEIEVTKVDISEGNVRKRRIDDGIEELAQSIEKQGLLQPIVVTKKDDGRYDLIVGQRRLLAFRRLERMRIPANILSGINIATARLLSLMENVQRRDIDPRDKAQAMVAAVQYYGTYTAAAGALGYSESTVRTWTEFDGVWSELQQLAADKRIASGEAIRLMRFDRDKALAIGEKMAGLRPDVRDRMVHLAQAYPSLTLEDVADQAKKPPEIRKSLRFYPIVFEALQEAASAWKQPVDSLVHDILTEWLQRYGYI